MISQPIYPLGVWESTYLPEMLCFLRFAHLIYLNKGVKLLYTSCACVSVCVYMWPTMASYSDAHTSHGRRNNSPYTHMLNGEKQLKENYLVLMGGHRDKMKNKACLLCCQRSWCHWGREGTWQPRAVNHGGAAFIETRAVLGRSQPEPVE